jgi:hypothetical protein
LVKRQALGWKRKDVAQFIKNWRTYIKVLQMRIYSSVPAFVSTPHIASRVVVRKMGTERTTKKFEDTRKIHTAGIEDLDTLIVNIPRYTDSATTYI